MITIELTQNNFKINSVELQFPIQLKTLTAILGESRLTEKPKTNIFTWDEIGISAYANDLETINSIYVWYEKEKFDFSPKNKFEGQFLFENHEIISYRNNNPDKLIMLFKDDKGQALLHNDIRCWFMTEKSVVNGIDIKLFDGKFYENPIKKERETQLVVEDKFAYLINLWENWKNAVTSIVPVDNEYYNLKYGITDAESKMYKTLEDDIEIPEELIAFYKIYNVNSNPITSAFNFSGFDWDFDLLPFSYIKTEWENIQDLQFEDSIEEENLEEFSEKVKADDYANPRWIPFAEGKNGDYLLYDTDPSELGTYGQIIELQNESWTREVIANSLSELIEKEINTIQNGDTKKYNFILGIDEEAESESEEDDEIDEDDENEIDEETQQFYDDEIKNSLQVEVKKGLYSTDEIMERILEEYEDEDNFDTLKEIAHKDSIRWKKELFHTLQNAEFTDVFRLQNALKNLEINHKIISPEAIGYTQDESIYEAETALNEKGGIGFVYFTEQDIERTIDEKYTFALGFNCANRASDTNFSQGISIGKTIVNELEKQGFEVEWNGTMETRICIQNFQWSCFDYHKQFAYNNFEEFATALQTQNSRNQLDLSKIQTVPFAQVKHLFPTDSWMLKEYEKQGTKFTHVHLVAGDWEVDLIDLTEPFIKYEDRAENQELYDRQGSSLCMVVEGNLKAKNIFSTSDDGSTGLIVTGGVEVDNMVVGGSDIIINKNLNIKDLFWGNYNHGSLTVQGKISSRVFVISEGYQFDYDENNFYNEFYFEDGNENFKENLEELIETACVIFEPENLDFTIENIDELDFEDFFTWNSILYRWEVIDNLKKGNRVLQSEFDYSKINPNTEEKIPTLFAYTAISGKKSFDEQYKNFQEFISYFRQENDSTFSFKLPEINGSVLVTCENGKKVKIDDGSKVPLQDIILIDITENNNDLVAGDEFMIWKQKEETGFKTLFKKPKYDYTNEKGESMFVFLYKNPNKGITNYRSAFELFKVETLQNIWNLLLETAQKGLYYKQQFNEIVQVHDMDRLLKLPMILEKYPNSWTDSDQCPWFGNTCYSFCQKSSTLHASIAIMKEIENINNDFDAKSFYFRNENSLQNAILEYKANYYELDDPLYEMRYSRISEIVPFYHYQLYKEAITLWKKALLVLPKENEKYLSEINQNFEKIEKKTDIKTNYSVTKPYEKVEIDGITFTLKDRVEATEILNQCTDFDNNLVYDPFYIHYIETENEKSFFLVAEEEVQAEKLDLETYPAHHEEINILGFIFLKKLTLTKYVEAEDLEFSPPLICMDDAHITSLILSGNTHYFHKNLYCVNLHGEYNHGEMLVKGLVDADFVFSSDFNMKFNEILPIVTYSWHDNDIEIMNFLSGLDLDVEQELNYLPGTHNLEHAVQDRFIYKNDKGEYKIKDEGYYSGKNHYAEGEVTFFEALRNGEKVLDSDKLSQKRTEFLNNAYQLALNLFNNNNNLKNLKIGERYDFYPNQNYNHLVFYFVNEKNFYDIGYWNTWFHFSISNRISKSGDINQHQLSVYFWDKENSQVRYNYGVAIEAYTYYNNICQKIFFEASERVSN